MHIRSNKQSAQSGQSTVEFIFVFMFGLSLIFMVMNSAINYCTGYLVHYATFMASRAYLTHDQYTGTIPEAAMSFSGGEQKASEVFRRYMLDAFGVKADQFSVNPLSDSMEGNEYLTVGAKTKFVLKADIIGKILGQSKLEMVSESFLGHEPTRAVCAKGMCLGITGSDTCLPDVYDITLYDDGC